MQNAQIAFEINHRDEAFWNLTSPRLNLMEAAGEICRVCESPVVPEVEAVACRHCRTVSHRACLQSVDQICPVCGYIYNQPLPPDAANSPLRFVEGELQRPRTTGFYRFCLVLSSLAMILLPLVYLGMVLFCAASVVEFAVVFSPLYGVLVTGFLGAIAFLLFYLGPIFIGITLTFFLVKPFFAPKRPEPEAFSLNHADAPHLFTLVGWICRSLDAPIPSRIDVDRQANAGAALRSVFGNDIVLVIGLPLVAGMDLSQFTGVLAHEYGHFSQGSGMRASYLIGRINSWFYRAVYERDKWDLALTAASEQPHQSLRVLAILYMARLAVWCTRRVLWVFMISGRALSCLMSRQMEFDADRYQIKMCGSQNFAGVMRRVKQLQLGSGVAIQQIRDKWKKERKLFDNIPEFFVSRANEIPADTQEKVHASLSNQRTRIFDMHPPDAQRIARALAANEPGIFHPTVLATTLFSDFNELSRRLTTGYYQGIFGPRFKDDLLISTEQTKALAEHDYAADREIIRRYFLGVSSDLRPWSVHESKAPVVRQEEALIAEIQACRAQMAEQQAAAQAALDEYVEGDTRHVYACEAAQLIEAGFQIEPADFALADNETELAQADAQGMMQSADTVLTAFEAIGKLRLMDAVQLLRLPQPSATIPDAIKLQEQAKAMIWLLSRLEGSFGVMLELQRECATLEILLQYRGTQPAAENVTVTLENSCTGIQDHINTLQEQTSKLRYPFHHATEEVMVSTYARNKEYHTDPIELVLREGRSHTTKLFDLHARLLANLIVICESVERALVGE